MQENSEHEKDPGREGGCLCGAVRYRTHGHASSRAVCHCRSCQLATGAAGVAWAAFERSRWKVTQGAPSEVKSSAGVTRTFCSRCGSALTYSRDSLPGELDVTIATFDCSKGLEPEFHIFVADKPDWVKLSDGLPQFQNWRSEADSD